MHMQIEDAYSVEEADADGDAESYSKEGGVGYADKHMVGGEHEYAYSDAKLSLCAASE